MKRAVDRRLITGLLAIVVGCRPAPRVDIAPERRGSSVRVGLLVRVPEATLKSRGAWRATSAEGTWTVPDGASLRVWMEDGRLAAALENGVPHADASEIRLDPVSDESLLLVGTTPYRGEFRLRSDAGKVTVIDVLDIETYLRGVVGWEIGWLSSDLRAAVQAQAIAARTYTCARLGQFEVQGFDLYADERDQVYKGALRDDAVVDRAIAATRGLVLRSEGRLIQAYYSSTCGGYTSWIEHVWPKPAADYLRGQRDAAADGRSYCADSPHFRWTEAWSSTALDQTLRETLPRVLQLPPDTRIGTLVDLRVVERDASARVLDLDVETVDRTYRLHGDAIRWALRPAGRPLLRSLMFELDLDRADGALTRIVARGGGNGHGVGMCQSGALGMARRGLDCETILEHYYPGARSARTY